MNKKSKLLKRWTQTATYLTVIATLISFTEPLFAGWVRDGDDGNVPPRRMVQVVLGITNHGVDAHPNAGAFTQAPLGDDNAVREHMRDIQPPISGETHIQFWLSNDDYTHPVHTQRSLFGAAGAQENAYRHAINTIPHGTQIVPANVTFSLHTKD